MYQGIVPQLTKQNFTPLSNNFQQNITKISPIKRIIKILSISFIMLALSGLIIWWFFPQVFIVPFIKYSVLKKYSISNLNKVPIAYSFTNDNNTVTTYSQLDNTGVMLKVPWKNIVKEHNSDSSKVITFEGKKAVILNTFNIASEFKNEDKEKIEDVFGRETIATDYNLFKALFNSTEKELSIFLPAKKAIGMVTLVILKNGLMAVDEGANLYEFQLPSVKGFIVNGMNKNGQVYDIYIFDLQGSYEITITLLGQDITQSDVDSILRSVILK